MRVLVTGAGGFIGAPLCRALEGAGAGAEVHRVSRAARGEKEGRLAADLLADREAPARLMESVQPEALVHLAWVTTPGLYTHSAANDEWVEASIRLLRSFADAGGRRVIVAGTCAEYEWSGDRYEEATTPLRPSSPYGRAKLELWRRSSQLAAERGLSLGWARLFSVFGPGEDPRRLVPGICRSLLDTGRATCPGGDRYRDFLFVDDLADALARFLGSDVEGAVNVASGRAQPLRGLAEALAAAAGADGAIEEGPPARADEPRVLVAETGRLNRELGWEPAIPLERAAGATIDYWRRVAGASQRD